jgi:hypothetical protein
LTDGPEEESPSVNLVLSIGLGSDVTDTLPLDELVENWKALNKEELEKALYQAWKEWIWEYIDGGADILSMYQGGNFQK